MNVEHVRRLAALFAEPARLPDENTTMQEIWLDWHGTIGGRHWRREQPEHVVASIEELARAIETLLDKHHRDSASKVVTRLDWPPVEAAAKRLLAFLAP